MCPSQWVAETYQVLSLLMYFEAPLANDTTADAIEIFAVFQGRRSLASSPALNSGLVCSSAIGFASTQNADVTGSRCATRIEEFRFTPINIYAFHNDARIRVRFSSLVKPSCAVASIRHI